MILSDRKYDRALVELELDAQPYRRVLCRSRDGFPHLPFINLVVLLLLHSLDQLFLLFSFRKTPDAAICLPAARRHQWVDPIDSWRCTQPNLQCPSVCENSWPQSLVTAAEPCSSRRLEQGPPAPFSQALPKPAISASAPVLYP